MITWSWINHPFTVERKLTLFVTVSSLWDQSPIHCRKEAHLVRHSVLVMGSITHSL
jgi:hypothetical protein